MKTLKESLREPLEEALREPLEEALFNKKTLSSISEFNKFIDKGASELFDFIIDEKTELSDYVIISTSPIYAGINGTIYGLVLCPSAEELDEFVRNADSWPELKVNNSLLNYRDKQWDIKHQKFILMTISRRKETNILDYGVYCFSGTKKNDFFNKIIIDNITVTKNIKNINYLREVLK